MITCPPTTEYTHAVSDVNNHTPLHIVWTATIGESDNFERFFHLLHWCTTHAYAHLVEQEKVENIDILHNKTDTVKMQIITTTSDIDFLTLPPILETVNVHCSHWHYATAPLQIVSSETSLPWEDTIIPLCRKIIQAHTNFMDTASIPLKKNEYAICRVAHCFPEVDHRTLADKVAIDKATLTTTIHTLRNKGFINQVIDPYDNRRRLVSLTSQGELAYSISYEYAKHFLNVFSAGIPHSHLATMITSLERLNANAHYYH